MIELKNVEVHSGSFCLSGVSFRLSAGDYAVLMGETGTGKTTLVEAVCGLRKITSGRVLLDGKDITHAAPADRAIGYVPQDLALFPTMTVRENLAFAPSVKRQTRTVVEAATKSVAELLGIASLLDRRIERLSGGESQRVALGRALAAEPRLLILDEPLSALDEKTREEMQQVLLRIRKETGVTTLHITHSRSEADALATRRLQVANGTVSSPQTAD